MGTSAVTASATPRKTADAAAGGRGGALRKRAPSKSGNLHAGETLVQAYNLKGTVPGVFRGEHTAVKFGHVSSSCATAQPVEGNADKSGSASQPRQSEITITSLSASQVDGKLTISFDDGSSLNGTFSLPTCATSVSESSTCL